jgi:CelD/BcsL family acetyltransferase involved in cellulose biosynthesis
MRIVRFHSLDALAPYAEDWEHLAAGVPFRGWTWLSCWWRHYGPSAESLAVLAMFDEYDRLVGVAPWYVDASGRHGRVLRPLGSGEVCSDYLSVPCHPAAREAVIAALADYLVDQSGSNLNPLRWDLLELEGVDAEDQVVSGLVRRLATFGQIVHRRPGPNCWRLALPTTWPDYVASVGKHLRRDVRRLERELLGPDAIRLHEVTTRAELPPALEILVDLHQRRQQSLGEPGCFASAPFLGFCQEVAPELFRRGQLELYWLERHGKPVAAEYQLQGDGIVYVYQAGVDPEAMDCRPGKLINLMILRRAIERGYRAYDFLRGDELYKAQFRAEPRPSVVYRVVPRRALPRLRHHVWLAGTSVKKWVKQRMGRAKEKTMMED